MSKYIVSVGDVSNNYPCFAWFDCCDLQEVLECFEGVSIAELKNYTLVLGENILKEAFWNERGEPNGDVVDTEYALNKVDTILGKQGLSISNLKYITEVLKEKGD